MSRNSNPATGGASHGIETNVDNNTAKDAFNALYSAGTTGFNPVTGAPIKAQPKAIKRPRKVTPLDKALEAEWKRSNRRSHEENEDRLRSLREQASGPIDHGFHASMKERIVTRSLKRQAEREQDEVSE